MLNMERKNLRLNNFILWCKGWYCVADKKEKNNIFKQAQAALYLDEYIFIKNKFDMFNIIFAFIDDLIKEQIIKPIELQKMYNEIEQNRRLYNMDYDGALLYTIKHFFAFKLSSDDVVLNPPIYSRKVFKLGFIGPKHLGKSYKLLNYHAKKIFNN